MVGRREKRQEKARTNPVETTPEMGQKRVRISRTRRAKTGKVHNSFSAKTGNGVTNGVTNRVTKTVVRV